MTRYTLAELQFIRDRVLAEIRATPPAGPLLTDHEPQPARETCKRGHPLSQRSGQRYCRVCNAERVRRGRR